MSNLLQRKILIVIGAPIDITPLADDKALAADDKRNNNFRFAFNGDQKVQDRCPFAAHIRKTNPRADLDQFGGTETHRIIRRGIQFGEELTKEEINSGRTKLQRGLLFVSYQSDIPHGFRFIQISMSTPRPPFNVPHP
jgi:deferrochelatase/peroxidase EfeB